MINPAIATDSSQIREIAARAGVFSQEEIDCVGVLFDEYLNDGPEVCGYTFLVEREGERILGFSCYGPRDLTEGVFDLYWIAVSPDARRLGVGRRLLNFTEAAIRELGGRMVVAETSGTPHYTPTRQFYLDTGYQLEASIKDFYSPGDDLAIFIKRF